MRHGPERKLIIVRDQLEELTDATGCGVFNFPFILDVPTECFSFIKEQFARFEVPLPPELEQLVRVAGSVTFDCVDRWSPYQIFCGVSDVQITDEWAKFAYEVFEQEDMGAMEISPGRLNTFAYVPGQAERFFQEALARPGLDALPEGAGQVLRDCAEHDEGRDGGPWYHGVWEALDQENQEAVARHLSVETPSGREICKRTFCGYVELSMWASFIWLCGPLGRWLRAGLNEITDVCLSEGECILTEGAVIAPSSYRKLGRAPMSCHRCGLDAWCVETILVDGSARQICESCFAGDMPCFPPANCGAKFCAYLSCPHHVDHTDSQAAVRAWYDRHGQLGAAARGGGLAQVQAAEARKMLGN